MPFSEIGAKATADYSGDALGITATAEGAHLRCAFQKLAGHATTEGLWLASTVPSTSGRLRLMATAVGRAQSSARSAMSIATVPQQSQAPLGAACSYGTTRTRDMPLLTELEHSVWGPSFYKQDAPNGAAAFLLPGRQVLARTGTV